MRFRSLVVSWCVCAIHGGVQIASGYRSSDGTSRRLRSRPLGDIENTVPTITALERFARYTASPSDAPESSVRAAAFPIPPPRSALPIPSSGSSANARGKIRRRPSRPIGSSTIDELERIVNRLARRRSSRRVRGEKCDCRERDSSRAKSSSSGRTKLKDEIAEGSNDDGMATEQLPSTTTEPRNRATSVGVVRTNAPTSAPFSPALKLTTSASTTPRSFATASTVTGPGNAITTYRRDDVTAAAEVDDDTTMRETYDRRNYSAMDCKRTRCMSRKCKRRRKRKGNVIDVLSLGFFGANHDDERR